MNNAAPEASSGDRQDDASSFTFAHLSDIHFAGYDAGAMFDRDSYLRTELELDLEELVESTRPLDAIILGGDIAGRGKQQEYDAARGWIESLCDRFAVSLKERVFCVPGNHDVDHDAITGDPVVKVVQDALLNCRPDELHQLLERLLRSGPHRGLPLSGLDSYNLFAARFDCAFLPDEHSWTQILQLGHLRLRIVGLASAILSGPSDAREAGKSLLGLGPQAMFHRHRDTFTIMVCHHPPGWFRDAETVEQHLEQAHLQLYGHEHRPEISEVGAGIRIDAGAVHPARREDPWTPSYNLVTLRAEDPPSSVVNIDIYPRQLRDGAKFGPSDEKEPLYRHSVSVALAAPPKSAPPVPAQDPPPVTGPDERQLAYRFVGLSLDRRLDIGRQLGLLSDDDLALPEGAQVRKIFDNARARGELRKLEEHLSDD